MAVKVVLTVHPGDFLRTEIVEPTGLNVTQVAQHLGVTRQSVSTLLNGHAGLSPEMALRFEQAFGVRADTLLRMQAAHGLAAARAKGGLKVKKVLQAA